ncbi:MAG: hypothetical protein DDG59_00305 [Anaerolineae bacterium]|jgi:MoaA/NifB/PqqE/SkfB family radical SAM enzyme|nr:MAG: hypothetical protein DDG59_00305 [Anaerolineae bacterium]
MKVKLFSLFEFFKTPQPVPPGLYFYQSPPDTEKPLKLFLRVDPNGSSSLVINASVVLHLNPVATEFAYAYLHQLNEEQTLRMVLRKYRIDRETLLQDYRSFLEKLNAILQTEDLDPIEFFGFERATEQDLDNLSAPFRLDCALTYRLPEDSAATYAPVERVKQELSTSEWKSILDKAWNVGIPHVIFTGGEPTLRSDLLELIHHAEQNGQICGLITDGHVFQNSQTLNNFLNAGLDHLMILFDPQKPESWEIIETISPMDIFTAVHLTINEKNVTNLREILARLASIQINGLSLSAISKDYCPQLREASELAAYHGLKLIWDLPVPYSKFNPVRLEEITEELWQGAGKTWLYIEPDGDVLPSQGIPITLGNFFSQSWDEIWQNCQHNVKTKQHQ